MDSPKLPSSTSASNRPLTKELDRLYKLAIETKEASAIQDAIRSHQEFSKAITERDVDLAYTIVERIEELESYGPEQTTPTA